MHAVAMTSNLIGEDSTSRKQNNGRTLLHYAADAGNEDIINNGANINNKDTFGLTLILAAIYEDHIDCVKYLLEQHADINGTNTDGIPYEECCTNS